MANCSSLCSKAVSMTEISEAFKAKDLAYARQFRVTRLTWRTTSIAFLRERLNLSTAAKATPRWAVACPVSTRKRDGVRCQVDVVGGDPAPPAELTSTTGCQRNHHRSRRRFSRGTETIDPENKSGTNACRSRDLGHIAGTSSFSGLQSLPIHGGRTG